jgi:flagellar motor switch protein FliM
VHRLPEFAAQLREDLAQAMRLNVHRRYWGTFQVDDVSFSRLDGTEARQRWLGFAAPSGLLGFALERRILLGVLNYRYGRATRADATVDEQAVRVTATEERLAVVLGQQLASILAARIESNLPAGGREPSEEESLKAVSGNQPGKGSWVVVVSLSDGELRDASKKGNKHPGPLAARLQVGMSGRLVSKETTLGAMFDLRVGDVIPISLHRADVMLEDSRLFTAAVTEHKGKLCLTSFEDIE